MDVDNDVDVSLLQPFASLGTTDKDVLIAEFQKLLENQINSTECRFYLDMANWYAVILLLLLSLPAVAVKILLHKT